MGRCFIILGMHRSATSLIAKGLHQAGVNMGERLLGADHSNPQGHYEDLEMSYFNRKILSLAGGDWYNIPDENQILEVGNCADIREEARTLIKKRDDKNKLWGWKDPRTTLTIKVFKHALKDQEHFFYTALRNPADVAKSLMARNGGNYEQHIKVAYEYNRRLLKFMREVCIDWT